MKNFRGIHLQVLLAEEWHHEQQVFGTFPILLVGIEQPSSIVLGS